jgi:hypothetical protein
VTYYVLFFIHLESRRVDIAGITVHPDELLLFSHALHGSCELVWLATHRVSVVRPT